MIYEVWREGAAGGIRDGPKEGGWGREERAHELNVHSPYSANPESRARNREPQARKREEKEARELEKKQQKAEIQQLKQEAKELAAAKGEEAKQPELDESVRPCLGGVHKGKIAGMVAKPLGTDASFPPASAVQDFLPVFMFLRCALSLRFGARNMRFNVCSRFSFAAAGPRHL